LLAAFSHVENAISVSAAVIRRRARAQIGKTTVDGNATEACSVYDAVGKGKTMKIEAPIYR
jgi:hypothetical protein